MRVFIFSILLLFGLTNLELNQLSSDSSQMQNMTVYDVDDPHKLFVPGRFITKGPKLHWFGYYDKLQFDPTGRYVLAMQTNFENRSPEPPDLIKIGMIDLKKKDLWIELGSSRAWNWQQGCMLQFIPGSNSEVIWNDFINDRFVCHIKDIYSGKMRTLPFPVYTLSPDGKTALSVDFERINYLRPGYGYPGITDHNRHLLAPDNAGIYLCDLETGKKKLIISLTEIQKKEIDGNDPGFRERDFQMNWFNHLLFNTDGSRFVFLHRWKSKSKNTVGGFGTLMYTTKPDGSDIRIVDGSGYTSHFIWKTPEQLLIWTNHPSFGFGFYLFTDDGKQDPVIIGKDIMTRNGHCTYLPDQNWILNDTYPDEKRMQEVYLYHIKNERKIPLGNFYLPSEYEGEWRIDTHPRSSPDGTKVVIDTQDNIYGRQMYLMDISEIIK